QLPLCGEAARAQLRDRPGPTRRRAAACLKQKPIERDHQERGRPVVTPAAPCRPEERKSLPARGAATRARGGSLGGGSEWRSANSTPARSCECHARRQGRGASSPSMSSSNAAGTPTRLSTCRQAPPGDKFRIMQSSTDCLSLNKILPPRKVRLRWDARRSSTGCSVERSGSVDYRSRRLS